MIGPSHIQSFSIFPLFQYISLLVACFLLLAGFVVILHCGTSESALVLQLENLVFECGLTL